jgi:hypothetical protein
VEGVKAWEHEWRIRKAASDKAHPASPPRFTIWPCSDGYKGNDFLVDRCLIVSNDTTWASVYLNIMQHCQEVARGDALEVRLPARKLTTASNISSGHRLEGCFWMTEKLPVTCGTTKLHRNLPSMCLAFVCLNPCMHRQHSTVLTGFNGWCREVINPIAKVRVIRSRIRYNTMALSTAKSCRITCIENEWR